MPVDWHKCSARLLSVSLILLSMSLSLVIISHLASPVIAASANSTIIGTTQDKTLYESSFQNFGFSAQGRYWVFYEDTAVNCESMGGCLFFTSSLDGVSWATPVNVIVNGVGIHVTDSDWSITTDGSHAFYVRYDENWFDSFCNRTLLFGTGSLGSDGTVVWQPEQVVRSANPLLRLPNDIIRVDSQGQVWIGYQEVNASGCGGTGNQTPHIIHSIGTNYTVWTSDYVLSTMYSNNWEVDIATLPGGAVYASYWINSLDLHGRMYNGTSWGPDEQISSSSDSTDVNSFVFASGANVYAIWYDTNSEMLRFGARQATGRWSTTNIGSGEARSASSLGRYSLPITSTFDPSSSQFYVYWYNATNLSIDQWYGSGNTWTKATAAFTTASATGEYTISSFYQSTQSGSSNSFGVMWVDQPSSPYNLNFGLVKTGSRPQGGGAGNYFDHVVIVIMENEGVQNICGRNPPPCNGANSQFLSNLANEYTIGSHYISVNPGGSQPNYIALIAGSTFNCTEASCPTISAPNLVDRLESAGLTWMAYMENQGLQSGCDTRTTLLYEYQHNPFASFADILNNATRCSRIVLANPSGCSVTDCALISDLNSGSAPNFMWLTPNDCNNMHGAANNSTFVCSPSISMGDNYLGSLVPNILNSTTFTSQRSALFVVFDEGTNYCPLNGAHEDCVYAAWAGPEAKRSFASSNPYNHYSFLRTIEANWNLASLTSNDASATPMTEFLTISLPPALAASFTSTPSSPYSGQHITFAASASGGVSPYSFGWNFGDGSANTGATATHSFATAGNFTVILTVKDSSSPQQVTTSHQTLAVSSPPPPQPLAASFSYTPSSPEVNSTITFTGLANGGTSPYTFNWKFGDGTSATTNPASHTYGSSGSFNVTIAVTDSNGATANYSRTIRVSSSPSVSFTFSPASPEANSPITFTANPAGGSGPFAFSWAFGDGRASNNNPTSHIYTTAGSFTVILTTTDADGVVTNSSQTISIAPPLAVTFGVTPATPEAGQSVSFTATSTGGVGGVSLSWAFGDGNSATGNPVSESYQAPGSFTVSVTAVDSNGAVATSSQTLTLASTVTVDFTNTPSQPDAGQTVGFTSSIRGGIQPYSSSWNFGDAGVGSGGSVAHSYQASGNYTVVLTVTDGNGLVARASRTITVNPPLSTSFTYSPSNPLPLLPIQFMGSATGGSQQYTYMWDFGDGSNATGSTVSHSYILPGTYTVTIAVTDTNGQTATASTTIVVSIQVLGI